MSTLYFERRQPPDCPGWNGRRIHAAAVMDERYKIIFFPSVNSGWGVLLCDHSNRQFRDGMVSSEPIGKDLFCI